MGTFDLSVTLNGFDEIIGRLKDSSAITYVSKTMLERATFMALAKAKEAAPVDKSTLRNSITAKVEQQGKDMVGIVGTNISYAPYQEFGTGIYGPNKSMIYPRSAPLLVFQAKDGNWIRAKSVQGVQAKKFMQQGLNEVKLRMSEILSFGATLIHQRYV